MISKLGKCIYNIIFITKYLIINLLFFNVIIIVISIIVFISIIIK